MSKLKERLKSVNPDIRNNFEKSDMVAQFISDKLKEKNWSKGRLAEEMGAKSQSLITRYMSGQHNFTFSTITELERALGCKFIAISEVVEQSENPITDDNIWGYLNEWHSGTDKTKFLKITRNLSVPSSNDNSHFDYPKNNNILAS